MEKNLPHSPHYKHQLEQKQAGVLSKVKQRKLSAYLSGTIFIMVYKLESNL